MRSLKFHEVFFCSECYRYIFAIEKNYHYPQCQNKIEESNIDLSSKYQMGLQKLNLLLELACYTQFK
jgi:hypothetical protein